MAVILVLMGGVMGFVTSMAALVFTDLSLLAALGIWVAVGLTATLLALASALLPRPARAGSRKDMHA